MSGHERFTSQEIGHLQVLIAATNPIYCERPDAKRLRDARLWAMRIENDRSAATREAAIAKAEAGE